MARDLPVWSGLPIKAHRRTVHTDLLRILLAEEESALLFSLSNYLTFRGCLVDSTERLDDARALVQHLQYDVVVVGARSHSLPLARLLTSEIAQLSPSTRVVLMAPPSSHCSTEGVAAVATEQVVRRNLPLTELTRMVCTAILT